MSAEVLMTVAALLGGSIHIRLPEDSDEPRLGELELRAAVLVQGLGGTLRARYTEYRRTAVARMLGAGLAVPGRLRIGERDLYWSPRGGTHGDGLDLLIEWRDIVVIEDAGRWWGGEGIRIVTRTDDEAWFVVSGLSAAGRRSGSRSGTRPR